MGNLPVSTKTISSLNKGAEGSEKYGSFYFDTTANTFIVAPLAVIYTLIYETYFRFYWAVLEVFLFPVWLIMAINEKWSLSGIKHNSTATYYGLEFV